jgi:putative chitinase
MISVETLVKAGIHPTQARVFADPLKAACALFAINTPARIAAFLGQVGHESAGFTRLEESLYYRRPELIVQYFSAVRTIADAMPLTRNPKALANRVYANRLGNGDESSSDGWRYRGRGLIQLTGRANYMAAGQALSRPYKEDPDLVAQPSDACLTAAWYWQTRALNELADAWLIGEITRRVNGPKLLGLDDRRQRSEIALEALRGAEA